MNFYRKLELPLKRLMSDRRKINGFKLQVTQQTKILHVMVNHNFRIQILTELMTQLM